MSPDAALEATVPGGGGASPDERDVHHVLGDEPDLELMGAQDVAHQQVVGAPVLGFLGRSRSRRGPSR